jgi:hypothetical protein
MATSISKVHAVRPSSNPRIAALRASDQHRSDQLYGMAMGELRRLTGMAPKADGTIDVMQLDRALAGQPVDRELRLKGMLYELGMIPR